LIKLLRNTRYSFLWRGIGTDMLVKKAFKLGIPPHLPFLFQTPQTFRKYSYNHSAYMLISTATSYLNRNLVMGRVSGTCGIFHSHRTSPISYLKRPVS
jgi:hypothetical protein